MQEDSGFGVQADKGEAVSASRIRPCRRRARLGSTDAATTRRRIEWQAIRCYAHMAEKDGNVLPLTGNPSEPGWYSIVTAPTVISNKFSILRTLFALRRDKPSELCL